MSTNPTDRTHAPTAADLLAFRREVHAKARDLLNAMRPTDAPPIPENVEPTASPIVDGCLSWSVAGWHIDLILAAPQDGKPCLAAWFGDNVQWLLDADGNRQHFDFILDDVGDVGDLPGWPTLEKLTRTVRVELRQEPDADLAAIDAANRNTLATMLRDARQRRAKTPEVELV